MSQPSSILDRLVIGNTPDADSVAVTNEIIRDLLYLLNTWEILDPNISDRQESLLSSVLNYGVANITGKSTREDHLEEFERKITLAIKRFEPRLDPGTVRVSAFPLKGPNQGVVFGLTIEGDLVGVETNRRVVFHSQVNSSTGRVALA